MGKGITRRRYGSGHPRSGSRARALYPPRWTLRENPSSQPGRDLARKYKTAQNFRNWWLRIPGTHTIFHHFPTRRCLVVYKCRCSSDLSLARGSLGSFSTAIVRRPLCCFRFYSIVQRGCKTASFTKIEDSVRLVASANRYSHDQMQVGATCPLVSVSI